MDIVGPLQRVTTTSAMAVDGHVGSPRPRRRAPADCTRSLPRGRWRPVDLGRRFDGRIGSMVDLGRQLTVASCHRDPPSSPGTTSFASSTSLSGVPLFVVALWRQAFQIGGSETGSIKLCYLVFRTASPVACRSPQHARGRGWAIVDLSENISSFSLKWV